MTDRREQEEERTAEPSMGFDEEGEFPVDENARTDDHAAWVHKKKPADDAG